MVLKIGEGVPAETGDCEDGSFVRARNDARAVSGELKSRCVVSFLQLDHSETGEGLDVVEVDSAIFCRDHKGFDLRVRGNC